MLYLHIDVLVIHCKRKSFFSYYILPVFKVKIKKKKISYMDEMKFLLGHFETIVANEKDAAAKK